MVDSKGSGKSKAAGCKVTVSKDGPYIVQGGLPMATEVIVRDKHREAVGWKKGEQFQAKGACSLCRCGKSGDKPYCDGAHLAAGFDGHETASRQKHKDQAKTISGPALVLTDAPDLCAAAGHCHSKGGTWKLTRASDDPESKKLAIQQACDCPSGRLVAWEKKTGKAIEPAHEPCISLVEDPVRGVSGPIWVKGSVPVVSAEGKAYEARNRVTLCRCGESGNKPFCDGSHVSIRFRAEERKAHTS